MIAGSPTWQTRIFQAVNTGAETVSVVFEDLEIRGGDAHSGGAQGGSSALGGGMLIDGGQVTLSNALVVLNEASG